jgi:hypothetical protein
MDDGQKQTINHVYHFLRDLVDGGSHPIQRESIQWEIDIKHMIWYLETNFPKDMLEHEMGDRGFLIDEDEQQLMIFEDEGGAIGPDTYSEKMQDNLEPIEDDEDA